MSASENLKISSVSLRYRGQSSISKKNLICLISAFAASFRNTSLESKHCFLDSQAIFTGSNARNSEAVKTLCFSVLCVGFALK